MSDRIIAGGGGGSENGTNGDNGGGLTGSGGLCSPNELESAAQECAGGTDGLACGAISAGGFGVGGWGCNDHGWGGGGGDWCGGGSKGTGVGGSGYISPRSLSGSFPGGTSVGNGEVIITTTT